MCLLTCATDLTDLAWTISRGNEEHLKTGATALLKGCKKWLKRRSRSQQVPISGTQIFVMFKSEMFLFR